MKVKDIKQLLKNIPDDFEVMLNHYKRIPNSKLNFMSYKYPYEIKEYIMEFDDVAHSDKKVMFSFIEEVNDI